MAATPPSAPHGNPSAPHGDPSASRNRGPGSRQAAAHQGGPGRPFVGNDRVLCGIVLGVLAFWLFAQTTLNIAPLMADELGLAANIMNIAVSITALFSGMFIVVLGGIADRLGRVRVLNWGFTLSIAGSLLVAFAPEGGAAAPFLIMGRILQGLSAAAAMSSSLALVQVYWEGAARQRAISLWSMGSWGGSGFAALVGGLMAQNVGWRWIFVACAALSALGMLLVRGTPESKAGARAGRPFDYAGAATFMATMLALQVLATQGASLGWTSPASLALLAAGILAGALFVRIQVKGAHPFVDFRLFRNATFTGAVVSNFLLNGTAGVLIVAMSLVQTGGGMTAQEAGLLTLGYAITIVAFIRVGERLLQRFGPRPPMVWGAVTVGAAIILLLPTYLLLDTYKIYAAAGFALLGLGLALYATPSTDAALSNLPGDQAGTGSGIYKMASSLGTSFGVAISAAVFAALGGNSAGGGHVPPVPPVPWTAGFIAYLGRQDNIAVREAGFFALGINLLMVVAAAATIMVTIPKSPRAEPQGTATAKG